MTGWVRIGEQKGALFLPIATSSLTFEAMSVSYVYLSPGFFGFSTLGSYHYFCHVEAGLRERFASVGKQVQVFIADVHPTASIRRRARKLVETIDSSFRGDGPIHLVGHSTGGLDARLVASPTMNVSGATGLIRWADHIRSVTMMNTPHYGTPMASFFATLSGQRLLYALSALTVLVLRFGKPPLALSSSLVGMLSGIEKAVGLQLTLIDRLTDELLKMLDSASAEETTEFLRLVREDQGAVIQLSPEAMDLFLAGVEDNSDVYYQCIASYAPKPGALDFAKSVLRPWSLMSLPIFATLHRLTSLEHERYTCSPLGTEAEDKLRTFLGEVPPRTANDGVVPLRSQIWGTLAWAGMADHLDIVGHFRDTNRKNPVHVDWLASGSGFDAERFNIVLDAIFQGMQQSE